MADKAPKARAVVPPLEEEKKSESKKGGGSSRPRGRPRSLEARMEEFFKMMAVPFAVSGDFHCASIVSQGAPEMASAWAKLAQENSAVKKMLERLLAGSAWSGVVMASAAVAIPIAAHHNIYPSSWPMPFAVPSEDGNGKAKPVKPPQPPPESPGSGNGT